MTSRESQYPTWSAKRDPELDKHYGLTVLLGLTAIYFLYQNRASINLHLGTFPGQLWNVFVSLTPPALVILLDQLSRKVYGDSAKAPHDFDSPMSHARKSEVLRRVLGLDNGSLLSGIRGKLASPGVSMLLKLKPPRTPAGLGNLDNSCFQNSVIQGLASVRSVHNYLSQQASFSESLLTESTTGALYELLNQLNSAANYGRRLWIPASLKRMSSWQQQDAQEYFSKIIEDIEGELAKASGRGPKAGLEAAATFDKPGSESDEASFSSKGGYLNLHRDTKSVIPQAPRTLRVPFEGVVASRVACLQCGLSSGLSLSPFSCLTVPLGRGWAFDLTDCLDGYTELESIHDVECAKCTLLRRRHKLEHALRNISESSDPIDPTTESLRVAMVDQLKTAQEALDNEDYSDKTLVQKCRIRRDHYVAASKTKQMVIARPPQTLVVHINRSMIDEYTGSLQKNPAKVRFPVQLDLSPWCLGRQEVENHHGLEEIIEAWPTDPGQSLLPKKAGRRMSLHHNYDLRSVVAHYGRHENGHFACFRKHKSSRDDLQVEGRDEVNSAEGSMNDDDQSETWWCLSDDEVTAVEEDFVLNQGGAFLLFYERVDDEVITPEKQGQDVEMVASERAEVLVCVNSDNEIVEPDQQPSSENENKEAVNETQESFSAPPERNDLSPPLCDTTLPVADPYKPTGQCSKATPTEDRQTKIPAAMRTAGEDGSVEREKVSSPVLPMVTAI